MQTDNWESSSAWIYALPVNVMAVSPRQHEFRLTTQLMGYWRELCGDRECPSINDLKPEDIEHIWPECFVVRAAKRIDDSTFRDIGETIMAGSGLSSNDVTLSQVSKGSLLSVALRNLQKELELGTPLIDSGEFKTPRGVRYLFRSILLPLSDDPHSIRFVLGGARRREISED